MWWGKECEAVSNLCHIRCREPNFHHNLYMKVLDGLSSNLVIEMLRSSPDLWRR